jgi:hypothetical protein
MGCSSCEKRRLERQAEREALLGNSGQRKTFRNRFSSNKSVIPPIVPRSPNT